MPTYTYKCVQCDHEQEEFHSHKEQPEIKCEVCQGRCEKQFTPNGSFILKGGGFPSHEFKLKSEMLAKNDRMKLKMHDREKSGEGVKTLSDLK
jgi:putative FmdB family regulatory protein